MCFSIYGPSPVHQVKHFFECSRENICGWAKKKPFGLKRAKKAISFFKRKGCGVLNFTRSICNSNLLKECYDWNGCALVHFVMTGRSDIAELLSSGCKAVHTKFFF